MYYIAMVLLKILLSLQHGYIPKDKDGFVSRVMSHYQQVSESVDQVAAILYNLAMLDYFPQKELKHFFSVESLGELDIRVESKCYALIEDLATTQDTKRTGNLILYFFSDKKTQGI